MRLRWSFVSGKQSTMENLCDKRVRFVSLKWTVNMVNLKKRFELIMILKVNYESLREITQREKKAWYADEETIMTNEYTPLLMLMVLLHYVEVIIISSRS